MKRKINKVAVLGSGVMGSRIACHFANIGVEVMLLDMVPKEPNAQEKARNIDREDPVFRNRLVNEAFQTAIKTNPSPLYDKSFQERIITGNFEDDLRQINQCDWIIEVIVEQLDIKNQLLEKVDGLRKPGTLITTNTSGIPIHLMSKERSEDFQKHFCGTHFFNPPRYLRLLEIIPGPATDPEVIEFLMHYGDIMLGKTTVRCKDTPAFIANRVGVYSILKVIETMQKIGLNIDEVDKLTGPVIGRPKSATFRTSDVVGLDTLIKVADNLYSSLEEDESKATFDVPEVIKKLQERNWLGEKTKQGFYKKVKDDKGKSQILTIDLDTFEYHPKKKASFPTLEQTKPIENLKERFSVLLSGQDKAGEFYRHSFYSLFRYITYRIPEIADELYKIDNALCAGFGWEIGPFETWDQLDVQKTVSEMEKMEYKPAQWVYDMLGAGAAGFYQVEKGKRKYWDINDKTYKAIPGREGFIILEDIREEKVIWKNSGASLFDIGDGILNLEFHSKMNTMGSEVMEGITKAIDLAEKEYEGLVIGNQASNFSVGANLGMVFMCAVEQEYDELELMIRQFQQTIMRVRYSHIPVIVAPHGMTLGGGCELTMHADQVQAAAETYIGLVEVGVGVIPAGGGTKELTLRVSESLEEGDVEYNALQNALMNIATAKVATSAEEARPMHILQKKDKISINKDRQIADAKLAAMHLAKMGYAKPVENKHIKVQGKGGLAMFLAGINGMQMGNYITEHDAKIARKVAYVMNGGELSEPTFVSEHYLLDLEREAFLSLCGEKKTLERIQSVLQGGKPVRN